MIEYILSPASGKVMRIEGETISIFMHLYNQHITVAPLDGVIKEIIYEKGKFNPAFLTKSDYNERNRIEMSTKYGDIKIVQIAGILTRRIRCEVKKGERIEKRQRIGKICFGSRVDVDIPEGFEILVEKGDKVKCRETAIAANILSF